MNTHHNHRNELWALWALAIAVIAAALVAGYWAQQSEKLSEATTILITGFTTVLPSIINALRNLGQSRAMQSMADHLGNSTPAAKQDDPPASESI